MPLDGWQAIPLSMVVLVGGLFPTIGGLGAVEGGLTAALCLFGARLEQALAVTALERGISYVLATAAGGALLAALGGGSLWKAARGRVLADGSEVPALSKPAGAGAADGTGPELGSAAEPAVAAAAAGRPLPLTD